MTRTVGISPYINDCPSSAQPRRRNREPLEFHRTLPAYERTPLRVLDGLARVLGIERLWLKDESTRLGLPSFKILGASWAVQRALAQRHAGEGRRSLSFTELRHCARALRPLTLIAATDGNHGRAVARMAALLGLSGHILVPAGTAAARIEAIEQEGADVEVVNGTYDNAVARSAAMASERAILISDTSWPGYEEVSEWTIDGYGTIFCELDDQLQEIGSEAPDLILVQIGVGAFATAVVRHQTQAQAVGVEPANAACVLASLHAGQITTLTGPQDSIMAGLNCGTPSAVAWAELASRLNASLAISDERCREAVRLLANAGVAAGESGAAGLAGLIELLNAAELADVRAWLGIDSDTRALAFCTEGVTDPVAYREILA